MLDLEVRIAAFAWLRDSGAENGGLLPGTLLNQGFDYHGRRITLKGAQGIWFPQGFSIPISITTAVNGPYRLDDIGDDGLLTYAYREGDPDQRDNRGLREAWRTRAPLVYFREVSNHQYQAIWPVIILEDHREAGFVRAAMDPAYADLRPDANSASYEGFVIIHDAVMDTEDVDVFNHSFALSIPLITVHRRRKSECAVTGNVFEPKPGLPFVEVCRL